VKKKPSQYSDSRTAVVGKGKQKEDQGDKKQAAGTSKKRGGEEVNTMFGVAESEYNY